MWQGLLYSFIKKYHDLQSNSYYFYVSTLLGLLLISEITSLLSLYILGLPNIALPWSWIIIVYNGFYSPVIISLSLFMLIYVIGKLLLKRGIYAWYAVYLMLTIAGLYGAVYLGLVLFRLWEGLVRTPTPLQLPELIAQLQSNPSVLDELYISLVVPILGLVTVIGYLFMNKTSPEKSMMGDARFSTALEVKKEGLMDDEGVVIGKYLGKTIVSPGFEHVVLVSPSGGGKSQCMAIPNLLLWPDSIVVNDPKSELFKLTSKYRQDKLDNEVFYWSPTKSNTHRYNPLDYISKDKNQRITDIQKIAMIIIPDQEKDSFWNQQSRSIFLLLVLYLLDDPNKNASLGEVYSISKMGHFDKWLTLLMKEKINDLDPESCKNISLYLNMDERTRSNILGSFTGHFELFANPVINASTSASDFDLRDLRKKKMTIYIGIEQDELDLLSKIVTIFWEQLISSMVKNLPTPDKEPYPVLCLMDEFGMLGKMECFVTSLETLRDYRVRVVIILQAYYQVQRKYGTVDCQVFKNIKTKVIYALASHQDAKYFSELLGNKTKKVLSGGMSHNKSGVSSSKNHQYQATPLMSPSKLMRMKGHESIILKTGCLPIKAKKYYFYKEKELLDLPCGSIDVPRQEPLLIPYMMADDVLASMGIDANSDTDASSDSDKKLKDLQVNAINEVLDDL